MPTKTFERADGKKVTEHWRSADHVEAGRKLETVRTHVDDFIAFLSDRISKRDRQTLGQSSSDALAPLQRALLDAWEQLDTGAPAGDTPWKIDVDD